MTKKAATPHCAYCDEAFTKNNGKPKITTALANLKGAHALIEVTPYIPWPPLTKVVLNNSASHVLGTYVARQNFIADYGSNAVKKAFKVAPKPLQLKQQSYGG